MATGLWRYRLVGSKLQQACGDIGLGRMLEPEQLIEHSAALFEVGELAGLRFVITGGPTREAIDPVRFITNHSSGKMAYALAQEAAAAGAQVTLISGPVNLSAPETIRTLDVESAEDMASILVADDEGDAHQLDLRLPMRSRIVAQWGLHEKKINTLRIHPTRPHLFVTASLDRSVNLFDMRKMRPMTSSSNARSDDSVS